MRDDLVDSTIQATVNVGNQLRDTIRGSFNLISRCVADGRLQISDVLKSAVDLFVGSVEGTVMPLFSSFVEQGSEVTKKLAQFAVAPVKLVDETMFKIAERLEHAPIGLFGPIMGGIVEKIASALPHMLIFTLIPKIIDMFTKHIMIVGNIFMDIFKGIFETFMSVVKSIGDRVAEFGDAFADLSKLIKESVVSPISWLIAVLMAPLRLIIGPFLSVMRLLNAIFSAFLRPIDMILKTWERIIMSGLAPFHTLSRDIFELLSVFLSPVTTLFEIVRPCLEAIVEPITQMIETLIPFVEQVMAPLNAAIREMGDELAKLLSAAFGPLFEAITAFLVACMPLLTMFIENILVSLVEFLTRIIQAATPFIEFLGNILSLIGSFIGGAEGGHSIYYSQESRSSRINIYGPVSIGGGGAASEQDLVQILSKVVV
jgi:phage-related protein